MTGQHVTEAGAAGLTGLVDIHRCQWYPEMLAGFNIDLRHLPRIVRAGTDLGPIDPQAAQRFGLPASCRFVVGCLDQYAGAIGAGNVEPDLISETTGTVLATVRCTDQFAAQPDPTVFQGPAFQEGLYWQMAVGQISANYLHWYRGQLPEQPDFDRLIALAEQVELGADGLRLRADVGLTDPEEVFEGLTVRHTHGHKVRCILETVACALGDQVAALTDGSLPGQIRCAGGAARSEVWLQIKADVLGVGHGRHRLPRTHQPGRGHVGQGIARRDRSPAGCSAMGPSEAAASPRPETPPAVSRVAIRAVQTRGKYLT